MAGLKTKKIYGWDGYVWESGDLAIGLVPQLGGRIMSLRFHGEELFFVQKEHEGETFNTSQLLGDKKKFGFHVWGGDKTWIAPEKMWVDKIPPLDLDAGKYQFSFNAWHKRVVMTSPVCRETGLRIIREIVFKKDQSISLIETIKNESKEVVQKGIWNVTQFLRPFEVYLSCPVGDMRLYKDEAFRECRPEYYLMGAEGVAGIFCRDEAHFKFGGLLARGKILYIRRSDESTVAFTKTFALIPNAAYAHGSHAEVYNSNIYLYGEIEVHSPLMTLVPGQTFSQSQEWRLSRFPSQTSLKDIMQSIMFSQF